MLHKSIKPFRTDLYAHLQIILPTYFTSEELSLIFYTFDHNVINHSSTKILKPIGYLNSIYSNTYNNIKNSQNKINDSSQRHAKLRNVLEKYIVYLKSVNRFKPKYTKPYIILHKYSPASVSIKRVHAPDDSSFRVHIDSLIIALSINYHHFLSGDGNNFNNKPVNYSRKYNLRPIK